MPKKQAKKPKKKAKQPEGVTVNELAEMFECSVINMRGHLTGVESCGRRGRSKLYPLDKVKEIMSKKIRRNKKTEGREELERRKLELQCERLQIDIDERLRRLIPVDEVHQHFATHAATVRRHLLKMAEEMAPLLEGHSVAKIHAGIERYNLGLLKQLREMEFE